MAEVSINIGANTQEANAQINQLNQSLGKTGAAADAATKETEQLEATLKRQEANIKIIDGAINLLGGSVELLASGLLLSGAASKEQAEEFEAAAIGAIAFADGTKRTLDGIKSLNEGLASYGGVAGAARKAQVALNAAIVANPWTALAVAVAAVSVALVAYYNEQVDSEEAIKSGTKAIEDQIEAKKKLKEETDRLREVDTEYSKGLGDETKEIQRQLNLLEAKGASESEIFDKKKQLIQSEINDLNRRLGNISDNAELENEIRNQLLDAQNKLDVAQSEYDRKRLEASPKAIEFTKQETIEILNYKDAVDKRNKAIKEGIDLFIEEALGGAEISIPPPILPQLPPDPLPALEKNALSFSEYLQKLNNDLNEFFSSSAGKAVGASLSTAANLAKTLAESQDESSEKAFNASKKYKIAAVVTSAIQSSFEAFGAAQAFGPILGPILGAAQVAAIAIASNKAIQDIQSSTFQAPGTPSISTGGGGGGAAALAINPAFGAGGFLGQPQGTITPVSTPAPPLRAYVVSADVTNGQQAQAQIQRRRVLGPG
jgi:hypothetical protein